MQRSPGWSLTSQKIHTDMIHGFENETRPLNGYEKNTLLPIIVRGLTNKIGATNAVSNSHICISLRNKGYKVTEVRIRKIINHIRTHGLVTCLVASGKGYYRAESRQEVADYIESLKGRENAIKAMRMALERQIGMGL